MVTLFGSRRSFLQAGALAVGGLTLPQLLRARAQAAAKNRPAGLKSIIMVYLNGGPSHVDMYDMKPEAPADYRGEFLPIHTSVPGLDISQHLPLQAAIADKLAIVRNMKFEQQGHTAPELYTGFLRGDRPAIGSVVSKLRGRAGAYDALPPNVYIGDGNHVGKPGFLGKIHEAFIPDARTANMDLPRELTLSRVADRRDLLKGLDRWRREADDLHGSMAGVDAFTEQAIAMMTTRRARDAFDVSLEPEPVRQRYGKCLEYLQARRLVEAGVPVVTINPRNHDVPKNGNGQWDHHDIIFPCLSAILPHYDRALSALITDIYERGLDQDVGVIVWGEMGRTPRVGTQAGTKGGRDHWPQSGFALLAGGGWKTGQVIGATDRRGELPVGRPYTPQNILATLYGHLGIDPDLTLADHNGRPMYLLDDREPVKEVL